MQNGFSTVSGSTVENRLASFLSERYGLAVCSLRAAPPERDAWFFMHRESRTRAIEEALAAAGLVSPSP